MKKTIVIESLYKVFPRFEYGHNYTVMDSIKTDMIIDNIKKLKKTKNSIIIYDMTLGYNTGTIFKISDHINRTGSNPLIGKQKELRIDFPDLSNLYIDKAGVITDCLGDRFNHSSFKYPSTWLCHISIIARAIGIEKVYGRLVSI